MSDTLTPAPCCKRPPMLRVRPMVRASAEIPYVRYECPLCGNTSGHGITENEAWSYWQPANVPGYSPEQEANALFAEKGGDLA